MFVKLVPKYVGKKYYCRIVDFIENSCTLHIAHYFFYCSPEIVKEFKVSKNDLLIHKFNKNKKRAGPLHNILVQIIKEK